MKGFTQRLVLKQRHKDTFIHELLTGPFNYSRYLLRFTFFLAAVKSWVLNLGKARKLDPDELLV